MITNSEGTELTLIPRLEEEDEAAVEVVKPPSEESLSLVERVFQRASSSNRASESEQDAVTSSDQLATAQESKERLLEALTARRIGASDEGDKIVVEGGVATVRAPFASPADCRSVEYHNKSKLAAHKFLCMNGAISFCSFVALAV